MAGTIVANQINTDTGLFSTNNAYSGIAKAWVNFAGATGTVNGSFNVSSVTRASTGTYTVNLTTAMPNANYAITFGCIVGGAGRGCYSSAAPTTTTFDVYATTSGGVVDPTQVWATVFSS